jgi:CubicO group peptidase (beta-lactamase class C family)
MLHAMNGAVHGHCDARFKGVAEALAEEIAAGKELGASIAVDVDGELVVDIWGGHIDAAKTVEWAEDTIVNVFSSTKNVTSLAALLVVDRGLLDPYAPVVNYWPAFAANGKEDIEVRHVLSHTSGLSGWEMPLNNEDHYDWDKCTTLLAEQAPWWPPGTASGYHALTSGYLVGELIRRTTGKMLKDFVREEISDPLRADFQIGVRPEDDHRVSNVVPPPLVELVDYGLPPDHLMLKTLDNPPGVIHTAERANTVAWRRADMGAVNGHGNARSLVRALSPLSLGGQANGVQLLSPTTIDLIFNEQANGTDLVLGMPVRWGIGFGLPQRDTFPFIPDEKIAFWPGFGGSIVVTNPNRHTTIGYAMNKMAPFASGSDRTSRYLTLIYEALN